MNFFCRFCYQELHPKEIDENMLLQGLKLLLVCMVLSLISLMEMAKTLLRVNC